MRRALAGLAIAAVAAVGILLYLELQPARHAQPPPPLPLLIGLDDDTLKWTPDPLAVVRREQSLGARAVRLWVPWHGAARPGPVRRDELARAEQAARHTEVVLAVFGFAKDSPTTKQAQGRFCGYARAALGLVPDARAVVIWNEVNSPTYWRGTASEYERLLADCYDDLHALEAGITVLDSTASDHAPAAFLEALGAAYRASGRGAPVVDAFGHNPYPMTSQERPWATHRSGFIGEGDYQRLEAVLERSFAGTGQRSQDVWYLEDGFQTAPPANLAGRYHGRENVPTVTAAVQARDLQAAILLAACQPHVRAFFNFELVDERRLVGWQSGLLWSGSTPKPSAVAFARVASFVAAAHPDCARPALTASELSSR
jgi:hypothetical protein